MSRAVAKDFLNALRRTVRHLGLYPLDHPSTDEVMAELADLGESLAYAAGGEAVISLAGDGFYLGRQVLAQESLEFNGLLRQLQQRQIDSITLISRVSAADLAELSAFATGLAAELPAGGSVRLNERPFSTQDLETGEMSGLRKSYAHSLDVLRGISTTMSTGEAFDISSATWAVENMVEQSLNQPAASLLLATVRSHDEYTFYHSVNVCILSLALGRLVGFSQDQLAPLGVGALLHDIGKMSVEAATLQHPGRLDNEQWTQIKMHPQDGAQTILGAAGPEHEVASVVAFEHHARFDESGYPKPTRKHGLHFFSRLTAVSDTYDAITTRRSYRRAETPNRALRVLLNGTGTQYDPDFTRAFIRMMGVYPPGSLLQLDTGDVVLVTASGAMGADDGDAAPEAVLVKAADGTVLATPEPVELHENLIVDQLLPDRVGIDPASVLEAVNSGT